MALPVMPTPLETQIDVAHRVAAQDASRGVSFGRQGYGPSLSKAALRKKRLGLQRRTPGPLSAD
jgi:3-deoxy-D-manno-octulosonic acid (KDO) 8-phosphate synthase